MAEHVYLVYNSTQRGNFTRQDGKKDTNPHLFFINTDQEGRAAIPIQRRILTNFPKSQHRLALIEPDSSYPTKINIKTSAKL